MASATIHFPVSATVVAVGFLPNMPASLSSRSIMTSTLVIIFGVLIDLDHISKSPIKFKKWGIEWSKAFKDGSWIRETSHSNYGHTWEMTVLISMISAYTWNFLPFISYALHMIVDGPNQNNVRSSLPWGILFYLPKWIPRYSYKFGIEKFTWQKGAT